MTLGVTNLPHKACLEMAGKDRISSPDRSRFMAYASRVMRGLIIDHARSRNAIRRGVQFYFTASAAELDLLAADDELAPISEALDGIAKEAALAQIIDIEFFGGFTFADIAAREYLRTYRPAPIRKRFASIFNINSSHFWSTEFTC